MGSDTTLFHGTDSMAYRVSERIRFGHNRFFLKLLAQVRDGQAFNQTDRVLDVGCGDAPYFNQLWNSVIPEFGRPSFILGIDSDKIRGRDAIEQADNYQLRQIDFFDYDSGEQWDVVYSSFCHAWLRAPRSDKETEECRDDLICSKLNTLIKSGGWFAAHYPGEREYFPYYNRLVLAALRRIGNPLGDKERYFAFRDKQLRVPRSMDAIREAFGKHNFATRVLLKTTEWIAMRRETEFLAYWESGGRRLLEGHLGHAQYNDFRDVLGNIVKDVDALSELGVKTFSGNTKNSSEFVLLPTHHVYHIAHRHQLCDSRAKVLANGNSSNSIAVPLKAIAAFQSNPGATSDDIVKSVAGVIDTSLKQDHAKSVYLAVIEAAQRVIESSWYADDFQDRKATVKEGRQLNLPTFADAIFSDQTNRSVVAALAHVTDKSSGSIFRAMGEAGGVNEIQASWIEMSFLWPSSTLHLLFDQEGHPLTQKAAECAVFNRLQECNDWPRLVVETDAAFSLMRKFDMNRENADMTGPFRYFLWQSRVGGPEPFCFLVFPQRLARLGDEGSQTCFLMWQEADRPAPHVTAKECALLLAMQPLAMMELVREAETAGEEQGREDVWADFSHETKQAAQAMRAFWSLPLNELEIETLLPVLRKRFPDVPDRLRLLPFPDVLESASFLIELWSTARSPLFLFRGRQPDGIADVASVAWNLAKDSIKAALPLHTRPNVIISRAPLWLRTIDETWQFSKCVNVQENESLKKMLSNEDWFRDITKLLIALFRNTIQHAHPNKPIKVVLQASSAELIISLESFRDDEKSNGFQGELKAINDARKKRARQRLGTGKEVIKRLVEGPVLVGRANSWEPYNAKPDRFNIVFVIPIGK